MKAIQLISITPQELQEIILIGISKQLEEFKKDSLIEEDKTKYLSRTDVAQMLQIDLSTLYHWTKKRKLISYGIGNRVYYKKEEVQAAIIRLNNLGHGKFYYEIRKT